ncbi:hypothetical protein D3C85_1864510 [compost metagenome]
MFTFGVGYLSLKQGTEIRYYLPEFIRDLLADALHSRDFINEASRERVIVRGGAAT